MNAYFVVNTSKAQAASVALRAAELLHQDGIECCTLASEFCRNSGFILVSDEQAAIANCDFIITVGGDGTILHTVSRVGAQKKPILGVNVGRMGFLATIEPSELPLLHRVRTRNYVLDERSMLSATIQSQPEKRYIALNDIVVGKGVVSDTIRTTVHCDKTLVANYRGDGVIVATPTGSTAYSLSAGGPILDAKSNGMVVTPICAHSLNTPPMVFAAERELSITISENDGCSAYFSCDGTNNICLGTEDTITVRQAEDKTELITFGKADQLRTIDNKLKGR